MDPLKYPVGSKILVKGEAAKILRNLGGGDYIVQIGGRRQAVNRKFITFVSPPLQEREGVILPVDAPPAEEGELTQSDLDNMNKDTEVES